MGVKVGLVLVLGANLKLREENFMRNQYGPIPPGNHSEQAGHHWLYIKDGDGRFSVPCVYQWQPGSQRWCHSGDIATGRNLDLSDHEYLAPVPRAPDIWGS